MDFRDQWNLHFTIENRIGVVMRSRELLQENRRFFVCLLIAIIRSWGGGGWSHIRLVVGKGLALICAHVFCLARGCMDGGILVAYHTQAAGTSCVFSWGVPREKRRLSDLSAGRA